MKRSRFTEEQIIAVLPEQESGAKTADLCRRHGVSSAMFYAWKAKFGGMMDPSEAKRLKALEDENTERPHSALGYRAPTAFAAQLTAMGDRLRAPETLRRSPIAPSAQPPQIQTPTLVSAG